MTPENKFRQTQKFVEEWLDELEAELAHYYRKTESKNIELLDKYIKANFHTTNEYSDLLEIAAEIYGLYKLYLLKAFEN